MNIKDAPRVRDWLEFFSRQDPDLPVAIQLPGGRLTIPEPKDSKREEGFRNIPIVVIHQHQHYAP